jgi:matrixin
MIRDLTIQGWKCRRDDRRYKAFAIVTTAALGILFVAIAGVFFQSASAGRSKAKAKADDPQVYFQKMIFATDPTEDTPLPRPTERELSIAVESARHAWEVALVKPIPRPKVIFGDRNSCNSQTAYACAYVGENKIVIVRCPSGTSLSAILMHEIGHLLGVPHIEGDALMNAVYEGEAVHPTPFAIAIAKAADAERAR